MAKILLIEEEKSKSFSSLLENKGQLAWGYFGLCKEYSVILSIMQNMLPKTINAKIYVPGNHSEWVEFHGTKDDFFALSEGIESIEFKTELNNNPLYKYFHGCCQKINCKIENNYGLLIKNSNLPNKPLTEIEIKKCRNLLLSKGMKIIEKENASPEEVNNCGMICGAEGPEVWYAIKKNKPSFIFDNCLGSKLFVEIGGNIIK